MITAFMSPLYDLLFLPFGSFSAVLIAGFVYVFFPHPADMVHGSVVNFQTRILYVGIDNRQNAIY